MTLAERDQSRRRVLSGHPGAARSASDHRVVRWDRLSVVVGLALFWGAVVWLFLR